MDMTIHQFFKDIHGTDQVNFRCIKKGIRPHDINGFYNDNTLDLLNQINRQRYECYFLVNKGGFQEQQITAITSVFVDLDRGRDEHGNYYPLEEVSRYKQERLKFISSCSLPPAYINETRNGLQLFWTVHAGATIKQFHECVERLVTFFGGDERAKNVNRLMRVPGMYWCKDPANKYLASIIQHNDVRYNIVDITNSLPEVSCDGEMGVHKSKKCTYSVPVMDTQNPSARNTTTNYSPSSTNTSSNIALIRSRDVEALQAILNPEPVKLSSHEEVYDYLKQQDLEQFLGTYGRLHCIAHDDANPSAGIIVNAKTSHHIYNCQSSECGFKGTIIQVAERLTGLNRFDALRFLRKVYRIEYVESVWQKRQREILEENKRLITSEEFSEIYPEIFARMKNYMPELSVLLDKAIRHVTTDTFTDSNGYPTFFASVGWVAEFCGTDPRRVTDHIALLAYLGLINKLSEDDIPEAMLRTANAKARAKGRRRIAFYSIPPYGEQTLSFSRLKAREFKDKGLTMKGWGRELLWRTLGEPEADRVYPQEKGKRLSELSEEVTMEIVKIIFALLSHKGWTTETEVLEHLDLKFKGQNQFKQNHIKRVLPELLDGYGLIRERATKELKLRFNIGLTGYPYIIIREDALEE